MLCSKRLTTFVACWLVIGCVARGLADDKAELLSRLKQEYRTYAEQYQDPATGLLYLATVKALTTETKYAPENARQGMVDGMPSPHGYGTKGGDSGMSDTALFGGQMLYSMLEAYEVCKDPDLGTWARLLFGGMKIIGTASPVPGFVVRGPHPLDRRAYYRDSSMDQHSTYVIALWRYYHSPLATPEDKSFIRDSLDKVARRLEKNHWHILWEDDSREAHASGGDLARFASEGVTLLLPMLGAAADVTQDRHWIDTYRAFASEKDGLRWQVLMPGQKGFEMNAHPLWGQQAIYRVHCLYEMERDPSRRSAMLVHAEAYTQRRMAQEFPPQTGRGELFELLHRETLTPDEARTVGWQRGYCEGPFEAWKHYRADDAGLPAVLKAKLRDICVVFPSSALTMAVFSRNQSLEAKALPAAIEMVNRVDLARMPGWPRWGVIVLGWKALALVMKPPEGASLPADQPARGSLPAIDCPLRRAGIDPTKLKPFEEVEKYIQFLERPDRAKWQKPDEVVKVLGLKGSETVADLGAGSGYFTFRLSKALPQGRVIAIDSQSEMVRHVHRKARTEGFANVTAQVATPEDPQLPHEADLVFVCDVLMHVRNKTPWLKTIYDQMCTGSRLVLIDFKEGNLPEGPPEAIKVPKAEILRLCREAGFQLQADHADLLPYQQFLVFDRP